MIEMQFIDFKNILMTNVEGNVTGEVPKNKIVSSTVFSNLSEETKRHLAVTAALELIRADVSAPHSSTSSRPKNVESLKAHMENLSTYADRIIDALDCQQ